MFRRAPTPRIRRSFVRVVVFADVDQTFLCGERNPVDAQDRLCGDDIALVLCSNMTRAELEMRQQQLRIAHPFICESGAAILVPHGYFPFHVPYDRDLTGAYAFEFGRPYEEVVDRLQRTTRRAGIDVVGFSDLSVEQVATECDLSLSQARLAKLREYDEPCRVLDSNPAARDRLFRILARSRLACTHQGVFDHVGAAVDKGSAVDLLIALYRRADGPLITVGLGDAVNSVKLLRRVRMPFVVESDSVEFNSPLLPKIPRLRLGAGVAAWLEAIADIAHQARDQQRSHYREFATG